MYREAEELRKSNLIMACIGMAILLGAPALAGALPQAQKTVPAQTLRHMEGPLAITFMDPLFKRTDFYGGSVIPVKILLVDEDSDPIVNATVTVWVNDQPAIGLPHFTDGNTMKNIQGNMYMFLLDTKSYPAGPGSEPITLTIKAVSPDDHTDTADLSISLD